MIRTFIAISVPEEIKERISDFQRNFKKGKGFIKWVRTESMHLTLKFLGDVEEDRIASMAESVQETVGSQKPFTISLAGTGVFPHPGRPRVLWVGVEEGKEILISLAEKIDRSCTSLGFKPEKRKFSAHLTLGRVKSAKGIDSTLSTVKTADFQGGSFQADEIVVMKSELRPEGAQYTPLHTIKLEG